MALSNPYSALLAQYQGITDPQYLSPAQFAGETAIVQYGTFYCNALDPILSIGEFSLDFSGGDGTLIVNPIYGTWDVCLFGAILQGSPPYTPVFGGTSRIFRLGTLNPGQLPYTADHDFKIVIASPPD